MFKMIKNVTHIFILKKLFLLIVLSSSIYSNNSTEFNFEVYRRAETKSNFAKDYSNQFIKDVVKEVLKIDTESGLYSLVDVYVWDGYYVVNLYSSKTYEAFCYRIDEVRNGQYKVTESYPGDEEVRDICGTCPSDTVEILLTACFSSSSHISRRKIRETYNDLVQAGVRGVVKLEGQSDATPKAVLDYLSCKNLKMWGRIGHGTRNAIGFSGSRGGNITGSQLAALDLTNKFLIINSCYCHNSSFTPNVVGTNKGNGYFFCAGDGVILQMYRSERAFHDIVTTGILEPDTEFGSLVRKESQDHCGPRNQYGFTRNENAPNNECKWNDVSAASINIYKPNGKEVFPVTSTIDITWSMNTEDKVSLFLIKGSSIVKTIVENSENDGRHTWKIPSDLPEGSDYKIRATSDTLLDESDEVFSIKLKPSIQCNTGEVSFETKTSGPSKDRFLKIENKGKGALAYSAKVKNAGSIMINEIYIGYSSPDDGFELWNKGPDQDMTGWRAKWNDDEGGLGDYDFKNGYIFKSGTCIVLDDKQGSDFYVGSLPWKEDTELSISLLNAECKGVDFVRTSGNNDTPPEGTTWEGSGVGNGEAYVYRNKNDDSNSKSDWTTSSSGTIGEINPGQSNSVRGDYWLTVSPIEGQVNVSGNINLKLTFKSEGLNNGTYYDTVLIDHDDPSKPSPIEIPCRLLIDQSANILTIGKVADYYHIGYRGSKITYRVPDNSNGEFASVKLYNLKGELVRTLVEGIHNSGTYTISINKENKLASGNYICRMKAKGFVKVFNFINNK